jgi:hypothetical protein
METRLLSLVTVGCLALCAIVGCQQNAKVEVDGKSFRHIVVDLSGPKEPWGKAIGDVNGDGRPDLIVGGRASGGLVWYEGPAWTKHVVSGEGNFSTDHEVADIDGDGRNDIVSLLVTGLVWFRAPEWEMKWVDRQPLHDVEVADLNRDGRPDLVARGQSAFGGGGSSVIVYLQADGGAWNRLELAVPAGEGLAVSDIDGDGWTDIVINSMWLRNPGGQGSWQSHRFTSSWTWPHAAIAVHDINGDGRLDIVLAPSELAGTDYRLSWFEAPEDRRQEWHEHIVEDRIETVHHALAVGDMDRDGRPDIVTATMHQGRAPHEVKVYLNGNQGRAWEKKRVATSGSHNLRLADLDGDGDLDIFGANWSGAHQPVEIWSNQVCSAEQGCPKWRRHVIDKDRPGKAVFVNAADLDGDGFKDVTAGGFWYRNPGRVGAPWKRSSFGRPANDVVWLEDFDGDGRVDALATQWTDDRPDSGMVYAANAGRGEFQVRDLKISGAGDFLQGIAAAQFASQGRQVALSWHSPQKGVQMLNVPANPLAGKWEIRQVATTSQDEALSAGDIDRDGRIDLLLGTVWLRNLDSSWKEHRIDASQAAPDRNRLADINRDGRLDAVVGFEAISRPGDLVWYEQPEDVFGLWTRHLIARVIGPMSLDVVDVDGDGDLDVIVGEHILKEPDSARLLYFENVDGRGGRWTEHLVHVGDEHHDGALAVDIDGDGDFDIVSIGWSHGKVVWYENLRLGEQRRMKGGTRDVPLFPR